MPNAPGVTTTPGYSSGGSVGHRTPTTVREERASSLRARSSALRRLHVGIALGAALGGGAAAAPAALAVPLTAHFGAADIGLAGITPKQARCQPKGLIGFGFPSGAGTLSPGTYFYVVKPLGTTLPFTCTPIPVGVAPAGPGENANDSAFIQWLPTPGATTGYEVYRGTSPATMALIATLSPAQAQCTTAVRCAFFDRNQNAPSTPFPGPGFPGALEQAGSHPDFQIVQRMDYGGTNNNAPDPNTPVLDRSLTREPFSCGAPAAFPQSFQQCATTPGTNEALRTDLLKFPDGLIASPHATRNPLSPDVVVKCARTGPNSLLGDPNLQGSQDPNEDQCPKESLVGTVRTITRVPNSAAAIQAGAPLVRISVSDGEIYNAENEGGEAGRLFVVIHPLCSAGYPQPFNPGGQICNVLVPPPNE